MRKRQMSKMENNVTEKPYDESGESGKRMGRLGRNSVVEELGDWRFSRDVGVVSCRQSRGIGLSKQTTASRYRLRS